MRDYADAEYDVIEAKPSCVVCDDMGCEFCGVGPFDLFTLPDLQKLSQDVRAEIRRRLFA